MGLAFLSYTEMAFPSTEGLRQIPLNGHFLTGLASADLKPKEILGSVYIPHSQKVRTWLIALKLFLPVVHLVKLPLPSADRWQLVTVCPNLFPDPLQTDSAISLWDCPAQVVLGGGFWLLLQLWGVACRRPVVMLPSPLVSMVEGFPVEVGASLPDTQEAGALGLAFPAPNFCQTLQLTETQGLQMFPGPGYQS